MQQHNYSTCYKVEDDTDSIPSVETNTLTNSYIKLTDGYGKMAKCTKEAIIRFAKYNKDAQPTEYTRAKLMLYHPWRDEGHDPLGGYNTYEEHFIHVKSAVLAAEKKYSKVVEDCFDNIDCEDGPPEHTWATIAPTTEENRHQAVEDGNELLTEVPEEDIVENRDQFVQQYSGNNSVQVRYDSA